MRKSKTETAETRRRIVDLAAKTFRRRGIAATGVAEIMAAAGLTHGGRIGVVTMSRVVP